jgi:hypothetical protein
MFFCRVIAGFGGWHMGNQSQDEVFLAAQEAVGAHRDSQGKIYDSIITTSSLTCINTSGFVLFTISIDISKNPAPARVSAKTWRSLSARNWHSKINTLSFSL